MGSTISDEHDPYFDYDLWYKANFKGKTLFAYNEKHLEYLESYIQAKHRESCRTIEITYKNLNENVRQQNQIKVLDFIARQYGWYRGAKMWWKEEKNTRRTELEDHKDADKLASDL